MSEFRIKTEPVSTQPPGATASTGLVLGSLLDGRFRIHDSKTGGFATVVAATEERSGRWYAIKFPRDRTITEFETESSFWLELDPHPNIVFAYKVEVIDHKPALFLEYVGGAFNTLRSRIGAGWKLDRFQALECTRQLSCGMEAAGRNGEIAHLDLKPENLMIAADGTLKVTDFGSARRVQVVNGRYPGVSNGSWPYMAPEWFGHKPVDSRGDIYSCGVMLYEMLTGHLPFEIDYTGDLFAQMSVYHQSGKLSKLTKTLYWDGLPGIDDRALRSIVSNCLQEYPGERPRSFQEIRVAVESILGVESDAKPPRELDPAEKFERALSLCEIGRIDRALTLFNRLMVERPDDVALWKRIATVLELVNRNDVAQRIRELL